MKRIIFSVVCATLLISGSTVRALAAQATTTARATNDTVQAQIYGRIHADSVLKAHDVTVSVHDGVATLTGRVATAAQRDRATQLANMKGITRVDNQIVVDTSARAPSGKIDRAAEKTKAGTNKAIDKTRDGTNKAVDKTREGTSKAIDKSKEGAGKAVDKSKEGTATGLAKTGEGVKKVGSGIADAFVLASVKTRLFGEDVLKGSDIHVDCDKHVVTLKGTVPNEAAHARALELAQKTDGVDRVVDRLAIGPKK